MIDWGRCVEDGFVISVIILVLITMGSIVWKYPGGVLWFIAGAILTVAAFAAIGYVSMKISQLYKKLRK